MLKLRMFFIDFRGIPGRIAGRASATLYPLFVREKRPFFPGFRAAPQDRPGNPLGMDVLHGTPAWQRPQDETSTPSWWSRTKCWVVPRM